MGWCLFFFFFTKPVLAESLPLNDSRVSQIVEAKAGAIVKLHLANKGWFLSLSPWKTMQEFSWEECQSWSKANGRHYSNAYGNSENNPYLEPFLLIDERDSKFYEVRKFADGNCWMAENLTYGGGLDGKSDYCFGRDELEDWRLATDEASILPIETNGLNPPDGSRNTFLGECLDYGRTAYCQDEGQDKCGYYYNWAAALQDPRAYSNHDWQPTGEVTGLCPEGWIMPSSEQFCDLDMAVYQKIECRHYELMNNFFQSKNEANPLGNYGGVMAGLALSDEGYLAGQGEFIYAWTSTPADKDYAYILDVNPKGHTYLIDVAMRKGNGIAIRCLKSRED